MPRLLAHSALATIGKIRFARPVASWMGTGAKCARQENIPLQRIQIVVINAHLVLSVPLMDCRAALCARLDRPGHLQGRRRVGSVHQGRSLHHKDPPVATSVNLDISQRIREP